MLHKYLVTCFDNINDTNILRLVQHIWMSKINFFFSKHVYLNKACSTFYEMRTSSEKNSLYVGKINSMGLHRMKIQ